jgi:hypothetical protein
MSSNQILKWTFSISLLMLIICLGREKSYGGGWPVRRGTLVVSPSFTFFYANQSWDKDGKLTDYPTGSHFESKSIYLYSEYGLSRRVTLVGSLPYVLNTFVQPGAAASTNGFTDAEIGARYYLTNINFRHYFAVQTTGIIPMYANSAVRTLGFQSYGADVKLIASGSVKVFSMNGYYNIDGGVRQYVDATGPFQYRYAASFGISLSKRHQLSLAASGVKSSSANKDFSRYLVANKNFEYTQASFNYVFIATNKLAFSIGANRFLTGKNTGKGTSAFFSSIIRF